MAIPPSVTVTDAPLVTASVDALVVGIHGDSKAKKVRLHPGPGAAELAEAFDDGLLNALLALGATGSAGEVTKLATLGATAAPVLVAVGLGDANKVTADTVRKAAGAAARELAGHSKAAFALAAADIELAEAVAEGALLGSYNFQGYKSEKPRTWRAPLKSVSVVVDADNVKAARVAVKRAAAITTSVYAARTWVNMPGNLLRPPNFANEAASAARELGVEAEILHPEELQEQGYGGLLAVGSGSDAGPRLLRLHYRPATSVKRLALVGKGITFDSGGISIKPAQGMWEMKYDMAGAAAVIAATLAIARLELPVEVITYAPMAENMPSSTSYRPGDIVTLYGGTTVEVLNTDAEGRMVLGDAIARACEDEPDLLLNLATLTGGQVIALGNTVAGLMGDADLAAEVRDAGERIGESLWFMPLPEAIKSNMDSPLADVSQVSGGMDRAGHMLQGGVFLSHIVAEDLPWAHLDIAGPAFNSGGSAGYQPKGATGFGVRTVVEFASALADADVSDATQE